MPVTQHAKHVYRRLVRRYPVIGAWRPDVMLFGNQRPLRMNRWFRRHHAVCRKAYRPRNGGVPSPNAQEAARQLRQQGYAVFPPPSDQTAIKTMAQQVDHVIRSGRGVVSSGLEEWMIGVPDPITHVPDRKSTRLNSSH